MDRIKSLASLETGKTTKPRAPSREQIRFIQTAEVSRLASCQLPLAVEYSGTSKKTWTGAIASL